LPYLLLTGDLEWLLPAIGVPSLNKDIIKKLHGKQRKIGKKT